MDEDQLLRGLTTVELERGRTLKVTTMNNYSFLLALVMLITLTATSTSSAQSMVHNDAAGARVAETTFIAEPLTLETPTGTLYGTLDWPRSRSPVPVVLIIAGSGPTDRDGNSAMLKGPNNSLKLLAEGLAAHGVADRIRRIEGASANPV